MRKKFLSVPVVMAVCGLSFGTGVLRAQEAAVGTDDIITLIQDYCYDCHGDGSDKGNVAFDGYASQADLMADADLWHRVIKNLRAELMPPERKPQPTAEEQAQIEQWIKHTVFEIDPANPDPGRVTVRRLNRVEYQNTIRDLMGVEFRAYEEFPPDDTGYGFDNIGDVLTVSPLLLEKYMDAAETIVTEAVPTVPYVVREKAADGREFKTADGSADASRVSFYEAGEFSFPFQADIDGDYMVDVRFTVDGGFNFDPGRIKLTVSLGDEVLLEEEHKWLDGNTFDYEFPQTLEAGEYPVTVKVEPLVPEDQKRERLEFFLRRVALRGPLAKEHWVHPPRYELFFTRDEAPADPAERLEYAREVMRKFTTSAFRRPVDDRTVDRLARIAEAEYVQPDKSFQFGIGRAMVAVLASPRFLFRTEGSLGIAEDGRHPLIDEYSLASRLSYFLWSTMPDRELFELAADNRLRTQLSEQVDRMVADPKFNQFVENFVGQWLQVRDVEGISINERSVLARDAGTDLEQERIRNRFRELREIPEEELTDEQRAELEEVRASFRRRPRGPSVDLDGALRRAMQRESEMMFEHVVREDRSIRELLDSDYTFLNQRLAEHYGIEGVEGNEMRKVALPPDSPRGGVLTQGGVLVVTSNPTRTSPVKRGVFVLDQILGTPPPPPPPDIPSLEQAEEQLAVDHEPTLRESLALHRESPLCSSCHNRMDPLGLALENFNALGMWRDTERKQPISAEGKLITGEEFTDIRELKRVLATDRRLDFYRCLTEKMLTYALGRGLEYYDVEAEDRIVERLVEADGRFSALLMGVIESDPFQRRRADEFYTQSTAEDASAEQLASNTIEP